MIKWSNKIESFLATIQQRTRNEKKIEKGKKEGGKENGR